jgi:hypothetical protein
VCVCMCVCVCAPESIERILDQQDTRVVDSPHAREVNHDSANLRVTLELTRHGVDLIFNAAGHCEHEIPVRPAKGA